MLKKIVFLLIALAISLVSFAQNKGTVTGKVVDENNEPIVGGSVIIKGTKTGTVTDVDGNFTLHNVEDGTALIFNYIGMNQLVLSAKTSKPMTVVMKSSSVNLDELVVVAYGVQKKRQLTTAVSSVSSDKFKDVPANSVDQVLQGRSTGVSIITPSGGVGEAPIVRIRGVASITSGTQPLYIVDGMPIETGNVSYSGGGNGLADLNPDDIQSIDVLKDAAAAALYGSRAANGVILITTKKGSKGKTQVTYNGYVGFNNPTKQFDVMNALEYVDFKNMSVANRYGSDERSLTSGYTSPYGNKAFNLMTRSDGSVVDTDWNKEIYRTGIQHSHSVALSGGTDKGQFYISGNYLYQKGMVYGDSYKRFGIDASGNVRANNWLTVGGSVKASSSNTKVTDQSRRGSQYATEGFSRMALILPPNQPAYNEDGTPYIGDVDGGLLGRAPNTVMNSYPNPSAILYYGSNHTAEFLRAISSAYANIQLTQGLTFHTQYGLDYLHIDDKDFRTTHSEVSNGSASNYSTKRTNATWSNMLTGIFSIEKNNFDVVIGEESNERKINRWGGNRTGLLDQKYTTWQGSWNEMTAGVGNTISESSLLSFFGRVNYDYDSRYLFSVNYRRDGYSALSKNNRWGDFGGISGAWRISAENFFLPLRHIVNELKVKGSWGVVGNTNIGDYAAWSYYTSTYYGNDGAYRLGQIADSENLKWETSKKLDLGFSATLFNRINIDFDYYLNKASDLILNIPMTPSKGVPNNTITTNAGAMENYGFEFNIDAQVIKTKNFNWQSSLNITTTKNKVTQLADDVENITTGDYNITYVGASIGRLYLYPTGGIDASTGRRIFYDRDGRKVLLMYERAGRFFYEDGTSCPESNLVPVDCGNTVPTYYGGWTNTFTYKNWDASFMFQFSGGNKIYNGTKATMSDMRYWNNSKDVFNHYWKGSGDGSAVYAYPVYGDNYSNGSSKPISDWVENGDYLRLKNIVLGYTFHLRNLNCGIESVRLYAQAQNLFVITGYDGLDPEISTMSTNANLQGGIDKNTLPQARTITVGVNVKF